MSKPCLYFRITKDLARKTGLVREGLDSFIEAFNEEATAAGQFMIEDDVYSSLTGTEKDKYLEKCSKRLLTFISKLNRVKINDADTYDNLRKALGTKAAYAYSVTSQFFEPEELNSFKNEVLLLMRTIAAGAKVNVTDYIDKYSMSHMLLEIRKRYENAKVSYTKLKYKYENKLESGETLNERQQEKLDLAIEKLDLLNRILGDKNNPEVYPGFFDQLCIMNFSEFKRMFGRTFNPESNTLFKEDETSNIQVDDETEINFEEEDRERWTVMMDSIDPSGGLTSIINNILGSMPDRKGVIVQDQNGNFKEEFQVKGRTLIMTVVKKDKNGQPLLDEDGDVITEFFPNLISPRIEARKLLRLLNSCITLKDMMSKLAEDGRYQNLHNYLLKNPMIQTTFLTHFKRYYLHYYFTKSNGNGSFSEIHLNAAGNASRVSAFIRKQKSLKSGIVENSKSIFKPSGKGRIEFDNKNTLSFVNDFVALVGKSRKGTAEDAAVNTNSNRDSIALEINDFISNSNTKQKIHAVQHLLSYLNLQLDSKDLHPIVSNTAQLYNLLFNIKKLANFIQVNKSSMGIDQMFKTSKSMEDVSYATVYLTKILEIVEGSNELSTGFSGMVSYTGDKTKTLSTNIMMSQLTEFIKSCNHMNPTELKNLILETYGCDSSLVELEEKGLDDNGNPTYEFKRFKVRWLQDLYESCNKMSNTSIRHKFNVTRTLGVDNIDFENISDRGHMISILSMYFNHLGNDNIVFIDNENEIPSKGIGVDTYYYIKNTSKAIFVDKVGNRSNSERNRIAMIPTFITGDTLALRGVTSLHYNIEEIIDGIYDFYKVDGGITSKMEEFNRLGLPVSGNAKESFTKVTTAVDEYGNKIKISGFGFCGFFNPGYNAKVKENGNWVTKKGYWYDKISKVAGSYDDATIKQIIRDVLNSEFEYFYEVKLDELGINSKTFKTSKGIESYSDEELLIDPNERDAFKAKLRDFYFNFRFSQMNQTALVDISPKFFANSKEHQKRNKVALTNGIQIVTDAIDPVTKLPVWDDPNNPKQKVVYVYDIAPALSEHDRAMLNKVFEGSDYNYDDVYGNNTISDGQGWRSFSSWRKIGLSFCGKVWTQEMEDAYHKIVEISKEIYSLEDQLENDFEINEGSLEDNQAAYRKKQAIQDKISDRVAELNNLAVVFQPRKPVCNGIEHYSTDGNQGLSAAVPFQHKYAEIPVIPALYPKGSALRVIGQFMEDHEIDMICSDKCGKKGVFGEIDIQYKVNDKGQYIDTYGNVISGYDTYGRIVKNPTRGEQRRNPSFKSKAIENKGEDAISLVDMLSKQISFDSNNRAVNSYDNVGSDVNGNNVYRVYSGVIHECPLKTYLIQTNVPNHTVSPSLFGTQPRKIILGGINQDSNYNYTIGNKKVNISGNRLITLWNALVSANLFKSYNEYERLITDPHRIANELTKNILNNDRSDLSSIDKISRDLPFWDPMVQRDSFASIISMFKNKVSKQKIHGGNIVQASSLGAGIKLDYLNTGLKFETVDGYPVKCETVMPFAFKVTNAFGETIDLEYSDYCNADGTFKVGRILEESDPEYSNYQAFRTADGKVYQPQIDIEYPGILDLVAYRIPTEREYSMLNLRIVRCCPKSGANFIQLPDICTTRAGFDFDIDKLYLIRRSFDSAIAEHDVEAVWNNIYNNEKDIKSALELARKKSSKDDIEYIKSKYEEKGLEAPKEEDIPLNRFWKRAVDLGLITEDKNKLFTKYADESTIKSIKFSVMDAFNADGSLNYEKIFSGKVTKSDIDNLMLDIIQARLSDPETAKARFTAGGFEDTVVDAKFITSIQNMTSENTEVDNTTHTIDLSELSKTEVIKGLPEASESMLFDDPVTSISYNKLNQAAGKLIGIFANASSNYFIQSKLKDMRVVGGNPVVFGSQIEKVGDSYRPLSSESGRNLLVVESMGKTTSQRLAELLAASVDAVKEPVLSYLNLNTVTADAAVVLIRMGYDTKDVGLIFNQPIIKEATTLMEREGISSIYTALGIILERHGMPNMNTLTGKKATSPNLKYLTREALAYNISQASADTDHYNKSQQEVVKVFFNLMKIKEEFSNYVQESRNTSSNSVKTNIGSHLADADRRESNRSKKKSLIQIVVSDEYTGNVMPRDARSLKTLEDRIKFFNTYANHPYAFEVAMYNLTADMIDTLIDQYTPFAERSFKAIFEAAKLWSRYGNVSADTYNDIISEIHKIIIKECDGDFNPMYETDGVTNFDKYVTNFNTFYKNLTEEEREIVDNSLLMNATTEEAVDVMENGDYVKVVKKKLSPSFNITKEQMVSIYNSWQTLSLQDSDGIREFSKALFLHLYYLNGLSQSADFNFNLVPMTVLSQCNVDSSLGIDYLTFMDEFKYESDTDTSVNKIMSRINVFNIFKQFIRQHTDNTNYVYKVNQAVQDKFVESAGGDRSIITVNEEGLSLVVKTIHAGNEFKKVAVPYIDVNGRLFELKEFEGDSVNLESCVIGNNDKTLMYVETYSTVDQSVINLLNTNGSSDYLYGKYQSSYGKIIANSEVYTDDQNEVIDSITNEVKTGPDAVFAEVNESLTDSKIKEIDNNKNNC